MATPKYFLLLMVWILISSTTINDVTATSTMDGCALHPVRAVIQDDVFYTKEDIQGKILEMIDDGDRIIKYDLKVQDDTGPFTDERAEQELLVRPYNQILTLDETGKALLNLREYFVPMSLYTLSYGVEEAEIELIQSPTNCLANVSASDLETYIKLLIFRNFENAITSSHIGNNICNKVVQRRGQKSGYTRYECCRIEFGESMVCENLEGNIWIHVLLTIIIILQVMFVLYSPTFVPKKDRLSTKFLDYVYKPEHPLKFNIAMVNSDKVITDDRFINAKKFPFIELRNLKEHLRNVTPGLVYTVTASQVNLSIRASKIFPGGYSPVGWFKFMKNFFIRCKMRNAVPVLKACCKANMFKQSKCCVLQWFTFLSAIMGLIGAAVATLPWIFRILFFYEIEADLIESESRVLEYNELGRPYPGSLVLYLTPKHALFIAIYIILIADIAVLILMPPVARRKLKFTIRMSMRYMNSTNKFDAFVSFLAHMLYPLEKYGVLGLIFLIPFWLIAMPVGLLILCYLIFPILNLTTRLLVNLVYYTIKFFKPSLYKTFKPKNESLLRRIWNVLQEWADGVIVVDKFERKSRRNMMIHVISLFLCVLTITMLLVLVVECIHFYIECAVYIVIGVVLNSNKIMKFLSLFVLIVWYAFDCFGAVRTRYQAFAKVIESAIKELVGEAVQKVAMLSKLEQEAQAFVVPSKDGAVAERMRIVAGTEGYMKWNSKRLLLFLDKSDVPYIPKDFLFKAAKLGHYYCPGPVHLLYLKALVELLWITLFLGFVMLVILAFGEANNISGANQTLATLAGGFIPFAFRKCFAKSQSGPSVDKSNIRWKTTLAEAIEGYSKRWTFSDLVISSCVPAGNVDNGPHNLHFGPKLVSLNPTVPDNIDLIIHQTKGDGSKMEFWVRKSKKDTAKPSYIWRSRQVAKARNEAYVEKPHNVTSVFNITWVHKQKETNGDIETGIVKQPELHHPDNVIGKTNKK